MKLPRDFQRQLLAQAGLAPAKATPRQPKAKSMPVVPVGGTLLALDPSSKATGWCVMRPGLELIDYGVIKPKSDGLLFERASAIAAIAASLCERYTPDAIVMEITSGKPFYFKNRKTGKRERHAPESLTALALAQGKLHQAVEAYAPVVTVVETEWTGRRPKEERSLALRGLFPTFCDWAAVNDPGHDAADSVELGVWYFGKGGAK